MKILLLTLLSTFCGVLTGSAQMQTITTYGNNSFPQTTTISPTYGGGYNYSTFGAGGSHWGGVTASPGTVVTPAIGPGGGIIPIVTPKPQVVEMVTISAPVYDLPPIPRIQLSAPKQATREAHREIPPPAAYNNNTYGKYAWLHNQLSSDSMKQLATDWQRDSASKPGDMHDPRVLLAYLRLWVRSHPGCLTGKVLNLQVQSTQKQKTTAD